MLESILAQTNQDGLRLSFHLHFQSNMNGFQITKCPVYVDGVVLGSFEHDEFGSEYIDLVTGHAMLVLTGSVDEKGWCYGVDVSRNVSGWFPASHVQLERDSDEEQHSAGVRVCNIGCNIEYSDSSQKGPLVFVRCCNDNVSNELHRSVAALYRDMQGNLEYSWRDVPKDNLVHSTLVELNWVRFNANVWMVSCRHARAGPVSAICVGPNAKCIQRAAMLALMLSVAVKVHHACHVLCQGPRQLASLISYTKRNMLGAWHHQPPPPLGNPPPPIEFEIHL